jgi:hypothetical protein
VAEELLARDGTGRRPSVLEEFNPYLRQRFNDGCTNASHLFAEISTRGSVVWAVFPGRHATHDRSAASSDGL